MGLPLSYSLRNVTRRPWRTGMTIVGVAMAVLASLLMLALSRGLYTRLEVTGEPENLLFISRKGQNAMFSSIKEEEVVDIYSMPRLATGADGSALVSPELLHVSFVSVDTPAGPKRAPVTIRGVGTAAWDVHRSVKVTAGRLPEEPFELLVGRTAYIKLGAPAEALSSGAKVHFENQEWTICGAFEADGGLIESEFWVLEPNLQMVLHRRTHSFIVARFQSPADTQAATEHFRRTGAIERHFKGWPEREYYAQFTKALGWVFWLSILMVAAISIAGALIGVNTMYTAIITRMDEIATLRALGFKRRQIAASLLLESLAISLLGGVLGAVLALLAHDAPMKLSQGAFYLSVDAGVMAAGLCLTLFIGTVGALLPAVKQLRLSILEAMRYE